MKNIFIYDTKNYFFVYAKKKFQQSFNVVKLNEIDLMKVENFDNGDFGVFVLGDTKDYGAFLYFYNCFKSRMLICSENEKISKKYKNQFSVKFLDISKPKVFFSNDLTKSIEKLIEINI